ncbi:MAG: F0F1 ATP synthase subunit B [Ignavibacteria bacterium]|jgi:F-type H+-transporting ATPase subunit b|nr:F0F1 ATP synthase subunit B [Ignavibacteria bacterium]
MSSFLSVDPGLLIWSIINFLFFLVGLYLIGAKGFFQNIRDRESLIQNSIDTAESQQLAMQRLVEENEQKMREANARIDEAIKAAKVRADEQAQKILADAQASKERILNDAVLEIERSKKAAIKEIRLQVADVVVSATEKILEEKLDSEKDRRLVDTYINQFSMN